MNKNTKRDHDHLQQLLKDGPKRKDPGFRPSSFVGRDPETAGPGWKVTTTEGPIGSFVSKMQKRAAIPGGGDEAAITVQMHEASHLGGTPKDLREVQKQLKKARIDASPISLHMSEEILTNGWLLQKGLRHSDHFVRAHKDSGSPLPSSEVVSEILEKGKVELLATGSTFGLEHGLRAISVRAASGLSTEVPDWASGVEEAARYLCENGNNRAAGLDPYRKHFHKEWANLAPSLLAQQMAEQVTREVQEVLGVSESFVRRRLDDSEVIATMKALDDTQKLVEEGKKPNPNPKKSGLPRWGTMEIHNLPLSQSTAKLQEGRKWKLTDDPTTGRLHRARALMAYGDRLAFRRRPVRKGGIGSILYDASGSMHLTQELLERVLKASPKATSALYSGKSTCGDLVIISRKGRMARIQEILNFRAERMGGNNVVDGPALEWLAKQPEPRLWVSDGHVTEVGDGCSTRAIMEVARICKQHKIKRVELEDLLPNGERDE